MHKETIQLSELKCWRQLTLSLNLVHNFIGIVNIWANILYLCGNQELFEHVMQIIIFIICYNFTKVENPSKNSLKLAYFVDLIDTSNNKKDGITGLLREK